MEPDLRATDEFAQVEAFYRSILEPGFGHVTRLGDPEPSPDGRWIAMDGTIFEALEGHGHRRVCLAATDGTGMRSVTGGPNDDGGARWAPSGRTLTFVSDRAVKGRGQLYALDAGTFGEARALPVVPGVVEHHRWSSDGTRIALVVAGEHAEQADALGSGTLGATNLDAPTWLPEVESTESGDEWRSLWIIDVASGDVRRASRDGLNVWEATWLGDEAVVAVVSEAPREGAWYTASLAVIDLASGQERVVYRSDVQLGFAEGHEDGSTIAVLEAVCSDRYVVAGDLLLVDPSDGAVRRVQVPGDVSAARWRGGDLLVTSLDRLGTIVAGVDPAAGEVRELWRTDAGVGSTYQPFAAPVGKADAFACIRSSARRPPGLIVVDDGVELVVAETHHPGHDVALVHLGDRRPMTWTAPDGLEIDGIVTVPVGDGPFPLLLEVHGGPIGATTDGWIGIDDSFLLSRGFAILAPNPRGSTGRGRAFAAAVVGDMGGADAFDDLAGVDAAVAAGIADPERIGVIGGSYGGFMAAWLPTVDPRFKAAVAISPVTDWYSEHFNSSLIDWVGAFLTDRPERPAGEYHARSPVFAGERLRTPTFLSAGLRDKATPPGQAIEMYRALSAGGIPAAVAIYPLEGHGVRDLPAAIDLTTRIVIWLERFMPATR